ncbi:MAG: hypothetical protein WEE64_04675 [Dehalococcoidia bacterium]
MNPRLLAGALVAPMAGLATGVWSEFADLGPPVLLAVAVPAIVISLLSLARLSERSRPIPLILMGGAIGLLTFAISVGLYVALHYVRGGGFDINDEESGGSAAVFFAVHVAVGAMVGVGVGAAMAVLVVVGRVLGLRRSSVA